MMNLLFPLLVLLAGLAGLVFSSSLLWAGSLIVPLLGVVMFSMGVTLAPADFKTVLRAPKIILIGLGAQYIIMPGVAWLMVRALDLPPALALGVILVGTAPGGTASNVMTFLARGDLALSVTLTGCSTLLSPLLTPMLTLLLAGAELHINAAAMFLSIVQVVILPVLAGMLVHAFLRPLAARLAHLAPPVSMLAIILIVCVVVALNNERIEQIAGITVLAVVLHNLLGMMLGYATGWLWGIVPRQRRTLALEVGLQNSGLAASLARLHFPTMPEAMLPAAFFSVWHNLSGAAAAAWWSRNDSVRGALGTQAKEQKE